MKSKTSKKFDPLPGTNLVVQRRGIVLGEVWKNASPGLWNWRACGEGNSFRTENDLDSALAAVYGAKNFEHNRLSSAFSAQHSDAL